MSTTEIRSGNETAAPPIGELSGELQHFTLNWPGEPKGVWSIERVVALSAPLFAALAGYCFTLLGKVMPGVHLNRGDFTALFVAGALAAVTAVVTWLVGRQKFVRFAQGADHVEKLIGDSVQRNFPQTVPELRQIEAALESHEAAVIDGVAQKVGLPPNAEDVAKQIVTQLWPSSQQPPSTTAPPTTSPPPTAPQQGVQ